MPDYRLTNASYRRHELLKQLRDGPATYPMLLACGGSARHTLDDLDDLMLGGYVKKQRGGLYEITDRGLGAVL